MDLNSIKLAPNEVFLLYKNSLVDITAEILQATPEDNRSDEASYKFKYLGENKKQILIVVDYSNAVHVPDKQLSFLTKLLSACNLNLGDVAILNFRNYNAFDFDKVIDFFRPEVVLLFKVEPDDFGMPMIFPPYQVQKFKNISFVASPSFEEIEPDKVSKSKLWGCLKKIFNL